MLKETKKESKGVKVILALMLCMVLLISTTGCSEDSTEEEAIDLNSLSLEELISKAKEDGKIESIGMPDTWANWIGTWEDITETYGLEHTDVDMSSAEELAVFEAEKNNATKDIGDGGQAFGPLAESQGLTLKYKTSYWDDIPDWAKDDDGDWIIAYYGTISILTNKNLVGEAPKSFEDILEGDYVVSVGDVIKANQARFAVLAAAVAMGGSETDIDPALEFFKELADQGRLDKGELSLARIEKGEVAVAFLWDYNALGYIDTIKENNKNAKYEVNIPSEGSIQSGYTTILNKYSKRPYAAALAREFILSDKGQINLAKGYAKPVRNVKLPKELEEKMIDDAQYKNARLVSDQDGWGVTSETIGTRWQEEVMAYAK